MTCLLIRTAGVALMLMSAAQAGAQSLGDVARQEEARRKSVGGAGKVYTNDRLQPAPPSSASPAVPAAAAKPAEPATGDTAAKPETSGGASAGAAVGAEPPKTEEEWRKRMADARDAVARSQTFIDALQSRINALNTDFENRDDPAQRGAVAADRQKATIEMDRVKKEMEQQQKAIKAIQDEARRAGVPAGWTR